MRRTLRFLMIYILSPPILIFFTPVRWLFDFATIYHPDFFRKLNDSKQHEEKVRSVQTQIRIWVRAGKLSRLCTSRPGWQSLSIRKLNKEKFTQIQIDLEDIIEIDTESKLIRVEPGMKMGTLTHKLLSSGWTIPVVPEFESLTVGGCVNGAGIESSSHKYGLFANSCVEYELVMADGSIVVCSEDVNQNLFHHIPWSHGTIGFLTAVTIPIVRAPKFVKLTYNSTFSLSVATSLLQKTENDFIEGIMFGSDEFVVMHGSMTDNVVGDKVNHINRWYKPWFYLHVKEMSGKSGSTVEYIPIRDYYHRHQRGYFWELEYSSPIGKLTWFRLFFGWIYPLNFQLVKRLTPESFWDLVFVKENHFLQDFLVPIVKMEQILRLAQSEIEVYPVWLCPCQLSETGGIAPGGKIYGGKYVDVGFYGISPKRNFNIEAIVKKFEKVVTEFSGYQFLYADTYMSREEFEKMFRLETYRSVRRENNCEDAFPEIYDKVSRKSRT